MENLKKRYIEESFPVKEVSEESTREKNIRHGHISTLHIWWARRPLAASRATAYAALIPAPNDIEEWSKIRHFIINLSKWENSLNHNFIEKAKKDILKANNGNAPRVLDPFAGGGSIPLEALRLGCETYAGEYNPVAVLILKCTLEYPPKYGRSKVEKSWFENKNPLLEDLKKWGNWVLKEAKKEIGKFYPEENDYIPLGYIWARTIPCQNPSCGVEIPLMRHFWLVKKHNKKIALKPLIKDKKIKFIIVSQDILLLNNFNPQLGTVNKAVVTCPVCGSTIDAKTVRKLFQEEKTGQRMIAVVLHHKKKKRKLYRIATERDLEIYKKAEKYLEEKRTQLMKKLGIDPVPNEPLPPKETLGFRVQRYGILRWGDLFNSRQKLALITFMEKIREVYKRMINEGYNEDYAKAITTYLALMLGKLEDWNSVLSVWRPDQERNEHVFNRQALPMVWDYCERNPFWGKLMLPNSISKVISYCSLASSIPAIVFQASATEIPYPDNYFDAVFTDPPYYDNVPYSYLSDFFYVWLKRTIGDLYPELFSTPLTPKSKEIVAYSHNTGGFKEGKKFFEKMLKKAFQEIYRVLKPNGIATIVYTHKSTSGWETVINSLLDSGLVVTASWPIQTEMKARLRARESAALASSIYFIARKIEREKIGWFNDVKEEIRKRIYQKLERLWQEGISGADFFISAIGSAIEVFGKYEKIMDYEGNIIRANKLLDFVRDVVANYAVKQILHNGIVAELTPLTKFYVLWRWTYKEAKVHFDDARKLAQSVGIDLSREWNKGFIKKEKEFIRVLGPQERDLKTLERSSELIDVLHRVLILWKNGDKEGIKKVLSDSGFGNKDVFYKVAQAISEVLPMDSKEKKLLDGFLTGKDRWIKELREKPIQRRLFE